MNMTDGAAAVIARSPVRLSAGSASLLIDPAAGGRASSLVIDGMEILGHNEDSVVGWGCFPMVPWPGRLSGNAVSWAGRSHSMPLTFERWALHGLTLALSWNVLELSPTGRFSWSSWGPVMWKTRGRGRARWWPPGSWMPIGYG